MSQCFENADIKYRALHNMKHKTFCCQCIDMFICIIHGDKQQFLVNINCNVIHLLHYLRKKLQLPITDIIDLCDEKGSLKFLFLIRNFEESAANVLTPRETYYICKIVRGKKGYKQIMLMLSSPDPEIKDVLKAQCDLLEKSRLKLLKGYEAKQSAVHDLLIQSSCAPSRKISRGLVKLSKEERSNECNDTQVCVSLPGKISDTLHKTDRDDGLQGIIHHV